MGFWDRWFESHRPQFNKRFSDSPHVELEENDILSAVSPGNETAWILTGPPVYPADLLSRRFRGEGGVTRLSLGKLLVNLLQVVKRADTPLIP